MIERQCSQYNLFVFFKSAGNPSTNLKNVGCNIAVSELCPFGNAGGAAGVLEKCKLVICHFNRLEAEAAANFECIRPHYWVGERIFRHHLFNSADDEIDEPALGERKHVACTGRDEMAAWCAV